MSFMEHYYKVTHKGEIPYEIPAELTCDACASVIELQPFWTFNKIVPYPPMSEEIGPFGFERREFWAEWICPVCRCENDTDIAKK